MVKKMCKMILNEKLNGVELSFDEKPNEEIRNLMKGAGYKWHNGKGVWYAKQNEQTLDIANKLSNGNIVEFKQAISPKNINKPLSERVIFVDGNVSRENYDHKFVGSNYTPELTTKEIAKIIRQHLKQQFPEVKFSVKSEFSKINIYIVSSPYCNKKLEYSPSISSYEHRKYERENNKELNSVVDYCKKLLQSYTYDDSDVMTDYFDTNFYGFVDIYYNYKQIQN